MPRTKQEPREIVLDAPATPANPSREYLEWLLDGLMFLERLIEGGNAAPAVEGS